MNSTILVLLSLCSLVYSAVLRQTTDKPALLARILNNYLDADPRRQPAMAMEIDSVFYADNDLLPYADTLENLPLVIATRNQGWIRSFIDYANGPMKIKKLYSNPPETVIDGQVFADMYRSHMLYFSVGLGAMTSNGILSRSVWLKFMYKTVRGLNTNEEKQAITQIMNQHDHAQIAVCILIGDNLHMWRKGAGAFLVIGTMGQGTTEAIIFPKPHHNVSFGIPCELTYSVAKLRTNDTLFFIQTTGNEGNHQVISTDDLLTVCQDQSKQPKELRKLIADLFAEKHEQHGRFRLDAFRIQKNRR